MTAALVAASIGLIVVTSDASLAHAQAVTDPTLPSTIAVSGDDALVVVGNSATESTFSNPSTQSGYARAPASYRKERNP